MAAPGFTIPSRLARPATISASSAEARRRVIHLYRDWYRAVRPPTFLVLMNIRSNLSLFQQGPEVVSMYSLDVSPAYFRHAIRQRFERNRHVTDKRAIDVLLLKSKQDYQETMNLWKLTDHVASILLEQPKGQQREGRTFLQRFYEGKSFNFVYYLYFRTNIFFVLAHPKFPPLF